jgi:hypothetical protein
MECNFQVGQKVVCVKSDRSYDHNIEVVKGQTYTIRHVFLGRNKAGCKMVVICLDEHPVLLNNTGEEMGWHHTNFRPLITTDISVFTAMLVKPPSELVRA